MTETFSLTRTPRGRLVLTLADGTVHEGVQPVRAFPLSAPNEFLALVSAFGKELLSIDRLDEVPEPARALSTDRGPTTMTLKAEEDIRRIDRGRLLISDSHGLQLMIDDPGALDARSRRFLERVL